MQRKVSRLGKAVSQLRLQRAARGDRGTRGRTVRWMKNGQQSRADARRGQAGSRQALLQQRKDSYNKEVAVDSTRRILVEKQMDFLRDFPHWAMNSALSDAAKGHGQPGEWRANRGPPYVGAITLFAGQGVDKQGSGNLVRRILGLKTSFRFHKWEGNSFLKDFDNPQFRYLYRNVHSQLIVPPIVESSGYACQDPVSLPFPRTHLRERGGDSACLAALFTQSVLLLPEDIARPIADSHHG